mgnify:CR=1 FL=1
MNPDGKFATLVNLATTETEKAVEIVAKSCYKILSKNGFSNCHIISVAGNILDYLIQNLDGYKEKSEKSEVTS